ncbi:MAG: Phosphatidylinositol 4-phosphate 5-kinase type-1 beta, partial [Paramarteilia canceri]
EVQQDHTTLLTKFYQHFSYRHYNINHKLVVMNNLFAWMQMHQIYDLKGSRYHRFTKTDPESSSTPVLKDNNFVQNEPSGFYLEFELYTELFKILKKDADILHKLHVTDYSLLIGILNVEKLNLKPGQQINIVVKYKKTVEELANSSSILENYDVITIVDTPTF